jgi:hypothetical protein
MLHRFLRKIWHGELSLYQAAYGLGGVGAVVATLLADYALDLSTRLTGLTAGVVFAIAAFGELIYAWACVVATWRSRRRGAGQPYSAGAVVLAVAFVWSQFIFTAAWTCWNGLATSGLIATPADVLISRVIEPEWNELKRSVGADDSASLRQAD